MRRQRSPDDVKARLDRWRTPMPESTIRLPFTGLYSAEEYASLARGFTPRTMDDRWAIVENDGTLSFHRSSTGICIYEVRLEREGDRYRVVEARANNDFREYGVGSRPAARVNEARVLRFLIEHLLLGRDVPFPLPSDNWPPEGLVEISWTTPPGAGVWGWWRSALSRLHGALRSMTRG